VNPDRPPLSSVDAVRDELRRLGYLDSGLDRFVLGGTRAGSLVAASGRVALRVGLLGGVVLGAALTLAAAFLDPRLFSAPSDLFVLALYLMVALAAAAALAAFAGGLIAGWWARRRGRGASPRLSRNVGLALGLAGLGYLAAWWRSHGLHAPLAVQVAAAVAGAAACVALGRFGALAAVAVLSAGGAGGGVPEANLTRRRMVPLLAAAALLLAAGVATASYLGSRTGRDAPDFAVVGTGLRVRVLGVDGLDPRMAAQMAPEMPALRRFLARAARLPLRVEPEQVPALVWTTVATGRGPEAHGILSTGARRLAGMRTPVSLDEQGLLARTLARGAELLRVGRAEPPTSVLRGVKAFWNVASEKGLRVGVVNWWATWPADAVNGYVVSDRAYFKMEKGGAPEREVHPPEIFERLRPLAGPALANDPERARRLDQFHFDAARLLRGTQPPDLEAVYLSGLDIVTMLQIGETAADLATLDARLRTVRAHYAWLDGLIGQWADSARPGEVLVLIADPGRLARRSGTASGLLAIAGEPAVAGDRGAVSERDVAPTVLHLLGIPRSDELDGRVVDEAFSPAFRAAQPVRHVASYGRRAPSAPARSEFDRAMLEELKSLGYIR
jgi:type I phosphodiesterase/nucleotide pyrophosphatase